MFWSARPYQLFFNVFFRCMSMLVQHFLACTSISTERNPSTEIENETPNTEFNKDRYLRWFLSKFEQKNETSTMDVTDEKYVFQLNAEFNHKKLGYR